MQAISNAFMAQVEVVQRDIWEQGPLELLFIPSPRAKRPWDAAWDVAIMEWNRQWRGGTCRSAEAFDQCVAHVPRLARVESPTAFLVPETEGQNELLRALVSLAPMGLLRRHGISAKPRASLWLWPSLSNEVPAPRLEAAAREFVWSLLTRSRARSLRAFSSQDPLRLLAADTRFWMHRLMRIALDRHEQFKPISDENADPGWHSLDELRRALHEDMNDEDRARFDVRRPLYGGDLWFPDDQDECDDVAAALVDGDGVVESIEPVVEAITSQRCNEDFSDRYSWIKEDFERSFYSKRARVRVSVLESVDECPAWDAATPSGYDNVLFRDVLSFFDARDRHIIIALRHGRSQAEIATDLGLKGHAAVSRRIARLKREVKGLLERS